MEIEDLVSELRRMGNPKAVEGLAHFGIKGSKVLGISVPSLRGLASRVGRNHRLAEGLWKTELHEARLLASMIDDPETVTEEQMEAWVKDFDSWDVVDQSCGNLFDKTPFAVKKALEWSKREREYEKRAGFSMMAELAVHAKNAPDQTFLKFLPAIVRGAEDDRNFVKKAVNWALRQIGKRNVNLHKAAMNTAEKISKIDSRPAKWIASDALRELRSESVQRKLKRPKQENHQLKPLVSGSTDSSG